MGKRNIMVEICLTSNDVILDVRGRQHPLREYIRAGVPVALATDDEGVARSDMTHEYLRGAEDQKLSYLQLKKMARTSLEHAFISGASLRALPSGAYTVAFAPVPGFLTPLQQPTGIAIVSDADNPNDTDNQWGVNSAQTAYILLRLPFRILIHADLMLPSS
jgi:hypothetical protein